MKHHRFKPGRLSTAADATDGDWVLQKADAIKGFLAQQRRRTQQSSSKTAWLVAWEQLSAEGELAAQQAQQALQPSTISCADMQQDLAAVAALHEELAQETQEQRLQLLGQVQDLCSLVKRAVYMGTSDLLPAEIAALASLQQEIQWLQQDTQQQNTELAAVAQALMTDLAAAVPSSAGASAAMLDGAVPSLRRRVSCDSAAAGAAAAAVTDGRIADLAAAVLDSSGAGAAMLDGGVAGRVASDAAAAGAAAAYGQGAVDDQDAAAPSNWGSSAAMLHASGVERASSIAAAAAAVEAVEAASTTGCAGYAQNQQQLLEQPRPLASSSSNSSGNNNSRPCSSAAGVATGSAVCSTYPELEQLLYQHPLAPVPLQRQLLQAYTALQQQHQQQLQEVSSQQRLHTGQCTGWTPDQHALFVWFRTQALQGLTGNSAAAAAAAAVSAAGSSTTPPGGISRGVTHAGSSSAKGAAGFRASSSSSSSRVGASRGVNGCTKGSVVEYLAVRMPGKSRQQLEAHDTWYTAAMQLQRRAEDLQESWQRQRAAFLQTTNASLVAAAASTAAAAEAAAARLSTAVSRQLLHEQLEGIQLLKQQQQESEAAVAAAAAAKTAATAAAEAVARQERSAEQRAQVMTYKQQLAEQQDAADVQTAAMRLAAAAAAAEAVAASKPAVAARQAEALQRLQQQQEQQRQRALDVDARQQRLAAIAAALAPKLNRDPKRALQATAASAAAAPAVGQAFKPVHGFTAQQVTADPRFRFVEALREAGALRGRVGGAGYLKQAMAKLGH